MMGQQTTTTTTAMKRTLVLLAAMVAALLAASGVAFAVNKVCPTGTTQANPCLGSSGKDTLLGTWGPDYMKGLDRDDKIAGGAGDDTTDGGSGSDTYSYRDGWGVDTLIDSSGTADHLNFSAVEGASYGVTVYFIPELSSEYNYATDPNTGARVNPSSGTVVEKVTGSSKYDQITTGAGPNTLQPGPGTGGAGLTDKGGQTNSAGSIPVSNDTYSGFAASGYGLVYIEDWGGTADKLVLPFASTDAYFEAVQDDGDPALDNLLIMTSSTDSVFIYGQLEPYYNVKGHLEQIVFTDGTITIGSDTQAQTISGATATTTGSSAEARVAELNEASNLDDAEKAKRSEAAKKAIEEAKQHKNEQKRQQR